MADAHTEVTIDALHDAIQTQLAAAFPAFKTVAFYRDDESEALPTPALLLEMTEAEPAPEQDAGTGQWCALARFEARIVLANRDAGTRREVRKAATALASWLHLRRWSGIAADPCQIIACEPDEFAPNLPRFNGWRVEWVQLVMLGESAWHNDGAVPEALYSISPRIGREHEPDYTPLSEATP